MNFDMARVGQSLHALVAELQFVTNTIKDKGHQRFQRPLFLAGVILGGSYYLLYLPPQRKLDGLQRRIDLAQSTSQNADAYKSVRDQLRAAYKELPKPKDKEYFLTQAIIETLKAEGITSESIRPPSEQLEPGVAYQEISMSAEIKFPELLGWLARLEAAKPYLQVTSIELRKSQRLGYCNVQAGIGTIMPLKDLAR